MATKFDRRELEVKSGLNESGRATNIEDVDDITYHIFANAGVFAGSYMLQGTIDGAHWFDLLGAALATEAKGSISETLAAIRVKTTVANGSPETNIIKCFIAGRHQRVEG